MQEGGRVISLKNCEFSPKGLMALLCFGQCIMYSVHHVWYSWFSEVTKYHLSAPNFFLNLPQDLQSQIMHSVA